VPTPRIELKRSAAHAILAGHPWVFREAVSKHTGALVCGETVHVVHDGTVLGSALADPESALLARIWSHETREVDGALFFARLREALQLRARVIGHERLSATERRRRSYPRTRPRSV
jgi:23S rRNA (cytosine1962-C5)-methyltransferase